MEGQEPGGGPSLLVGTVKSSSGGTEEVTGNYDANLLQENTNPMLNPNVLKELFQVCPAEGLKEMRLVCKMWNENSFPRWRQNAKLKLVIEDMFDRGYMTLGEFMLDVVPSDKYRMVSKPFESYIISGWRMHAGDEEESHFWRTCGPWMKRLEFQRCKVFDDMKEFTDTIFRYTPNVEELKIEHCQFMFNEQPLENLQEQRNLKILRVALTPPHYYFPISWMAIFKTFPNLQVLELKYFSNYGELDDIIHCIGIIRRDDKAKLNIKRLEIIDIRPEENKKFPLRTAQRFVSAKLPLESLSIDLGLETEEQTVRRILHAHAKTLKTLHAFRGPYTKPFLSFPMGVRMESLTELKLCGPIAPNLILLKVMPNLKKLLINGSHLQEGKLVKPEYFPAIWSYGFPLPTDMVSATMQYDVMQGLVMKNLVELELEVRIHHSGIRALGQWMPHLKKLRMPVLSNAGFWAVCELWSGLEVLELLYGTKVDDEGITGMKKAEPTNEIKSLYNITSLKDLRTFEVQGYNFQSENYEFTEFSLIHGFLKLSKLNSLHIMLKNQVSKELVKAMKQKISTVEAFIKIEETDRDRVIAFDSDESKDQPNDKPEADGVQPEGAQAQERLVSASLVSEVHFP